MAHLNPPKLTAEERAVLFKRPLWKPVLQTVFVAAVYAVGVFIVTNPALGPARFLGCPLLSLILAGCLAAGHDCFHSSLYNGKRTNRVAGAIWCALVLTNFSATKHSHLVHHRYTGEERDSEPRFNVPTFSAYVMQFLRPAILIPRAVLKAARVVSGRLVPPHLATERARKGAREDAALILLWAAIAGGLTVWAPLAMVFAYWIPIAFFPAAAIAIAMPEHHRCGDGDDLLDVTRTTETNWLARLLIWNSNYHVEHHLYPAVPSCNLRKLHRRVRPTLRHFAPSYRAFHAGLVRDLVAREQRTYRP
ncbi:MAG: fatty acid desaturase family protein [Haliangiales bacterium]